MQEDLMSKFKKKIESTVVNNNLSRHQQNQEKFYEMHDMGNTQQVMYPGQDQRSIDQTGQLKNFIDNELDITRESPVNITSKQIM